MYCFHSFTATIIPNLMIKAIVLLGYRALFNFFFLVLGGPECAVIHVLSWVSTTFLIDLITFPMTESKIETTSELTGVGSVFDVPGASLVAQLDICLHEPFLFFFFSSFSWWAYTFGTLLTGFGLLPPQPELVREILEGGKHGRRELNRDGKFQGLILDVNTYGLRWLCK